MTMLLIGLDGATFDFIKPMIEKGKLPTFKRLIDGGVHGTLKSTYPPVTVPAWPAMFSGKGPDKLGAFDFRCMDSNYRIKLHDRSTICCTYVWEIMNESGKKAAVLNVPGTWPMKPVDKYIVSGMLTPPGRGFALPKVLQDRIEKEIPGYSTALMENGDKISSSYRTFEARASMLEWFLPKLGNSIDSIFMVFRVPDVLSHSRDAGPKELEECYKRIDERLSTILEKVEANVLIVSDHGYGFSEGRKMLFINKWLEENGYIFFEKKPNVSKSAMRARSMLTGRLGKAAKPLVRRLKNRVPETSLPFDPSCIDMRRTKAFSYNTTTSPYCGIWINRKGVYKDGCVDGDYEHVRDEIISKLKAENLVVTAWKRDDIFHVHNDRMPDIIVEGRGLISTGFSAVMESTYKSCHLINGIFIAHGPDIAVGKEIANARITDIAPTVLHMFSLPIPDDM
ncbi:MAG: hypothetical protein DRO99_02355, partial [Candidatus Aenigmatarchaeota archaeon]